jgi:hypothetical protein
MLLSYLSSAAENFHTKTPVGITAAGFYGAVFALSSRSGTRSRQRVAELEALSKPVYISHGQRVESIDLRERLVCAAFTGLAGHPSDEHPNHHLAELAVKSVKAADAMIAAMRKGEA